MDFEMKTEFGDYARVETYHDNSVLVELGYRGERSSSVALNENQAMQLGVALLPRVDRPTETKNLPPVGTAVLSEYEDVGPAVIQYADEVTTTGLVRWCALSDLLIHNKAPEWKTPVEVAAKWTAETIPKEGSWMGYDKDGPNAGYLTRITDDWAYSADMANMYNILYFLRMA